MTVDIQKIQTRYKGEKAASESTAPALPTDRDNSLDYLAAVLRGGIKDQGLYEQARHQCSTVVQIMDAARESVRTGKTVVLKPLP